MSAPPFPRTDAAVEPPTSALRRVAGWLRLFWPAPAGVNQRERLRMVSGIALCVAVVALFAHWFGAGLPVPWMVASLGSSAVLIIAMPSSPLAQPWPVLAGSVLSYMVGVACATLVPNVALACGAAVGLAVAVMLALRCLHPPGGAMALFAVLNPQDGAAFAVFPVLLNMLALVLTGMAFNHLTGRSYPHAQRARGAAHKGSGAFISADLDAALSHYNQVLDVSRADLEGLLHLAGKAAFQRTLGELRCGEIMSSPVHAVVAETPLKDAWALMRKHAVKALPVVDGARRVVGIVTVADFMRLANLDMHEGMGQRLRSLIMGRPKRPEQVQGLMSSPVQQVLSEQHVMDLVPLFSEAGHHHIPVVNDAQELVGIITQTDLVKTLAAAVARP
ncbi:MAG: HPP family protein [Diaphorobacter nitroreducens]|uniref:HPP family protein n=2 Tax=Diaphorobacter nitroreducens TaxID=164759 RepID=UPI00289D3A8D|nr:HPP family protein [Diaphorobacter nitroreducens]